MTDGARTSEPVKVADAISLEQSLRRSIGKVRPRSSDVIEFCCADCKNDPNIPGSRGQTMGVVWGSHNEDPSISVWIPTRRNFHDVGIGPEDPGDVLPLDATDPKMVSMSCRVSWHAPRRKLPAWLLSRAEKARDEHHLVVHL
jgi:hypothetical protein